MIGLVLVTHGRLADELRSAMEHVVGRQRHVATVCIGPDDDIEQRRADVARCIDEVDAGDGVVLLTDMFGGTPSNLAISQMDRKGVEVIAGVNLPMLVKLAKVRCDRPLADAVDCAETAGRKYIATASKALPNCRISVPVSPIPASSIPTCAVQTSAVVSISQAVLSEAVLAVPVVNGSTLAHVSNGKLNGTLG